MTIITVAESARTADDAFEVSVQFAGGGQHVATVTDPLALDPNGERLLTWYFEEHLRYPFLDRDRERSAVDLLAAYGTELFVQVFEASSDCSHELRRFRDGGWDGVRIEIAGSADFHRLHWEALRDGGPGAALGARVPISRRVVDVAAGFDIAEGGPALNVLVVTARPHGARDVGYRTISRPLLAALRQARIPVALDLVRPGSWQALRDHLQAATRRKGSGWYGIVHFDVHGAIASMDELRGDGPDDYLLTEDAASAAGEEGAYLFFETPEVGIAEPVPTSKVADLLVEHRVPVAVLNACQSAMQTRGSEASLAQRLVESGVPVAVGMAYSVTVSAAELMMPVVYKQLAEGVEILPAVHAGRRQLFDVRGRRAYFDQEVDLEDWVLPVAFSQRPVKLQPRPATPEQIEEIYAKKAWHLKEPQPEYGFVGRDLDVQAIERRLVGEGAHNELLVSGMAGAGKSTLLEHLGWWWQATGLVERVFSFSYEERAWTVDQILQEIIDKLLSGHEQVLAHALPADAQLERVAALLCADRHLLLLDNAESITATPAAIPHSLPEEERARLERLLSSLRGGKTLVLIGSREPERWLASSSFGSNTYELGGLDPQATSILLERIITRHGGLLPDSSAERKALEDLVDLLGGYPLALSVVLPVVASASPSEVLAELARGGEAVDPAGVIQSAIEFSHGRLDPTTQNSLVVLAPFTGVVLKRALDLYRELLEPHESVAALGALELDGALDHAISAGLASPDAQSRDHVRLQPLLPFFLRTRLADRPDLLAAAAQAHYDLYQRLGPSLHSLLRSRDPGPRAAGRVLAHAEYPNLMGALGHALVNGAPLESLVGPLEEYLDQTHQEYARQQLLERAIAAVGEPSTTDRKVELAYMHNLTGIAALGRHDLDNARAHHEAEIVLREELGDRGSTASTHHQLGRVAQEQRHLEEAEAHYRKALEIKLEFNDRYGTARTHHQLGRVAQEQHRLEEAEAHYAKALEIKLEFNDRHSAAASYHQLGIVAQERHRLKEAEAHYRKALEIFEEFNDRYETADVYHQLGIVAEEERRLEEAEAHYRKALEIFEEFNDRRSAATVYHQLGRVAQEQHRLEEAEAHYRKALEIFEEFNDRHSAAVTYHQLGRIAEEQHRLEEAEAHYRKALEIFEEFNDRHSAATSYHQLGVVAEEQHRLEEAEAYYAKALEIKLEFNDRHSAAASYHQLGIIAEEQRRFEEAGAHYAKALEIKLEFNDRYGTATTYHQLGRVAQEQHRLEEAEAHYAKALEILEEFGDSQRAAISQSQLGALLTSPERAEEAITYSLAALLTRLDVASQWSEFDLRRLKRQRELVGPQRFQAEVVRQTDEKVFARLTQLLGQVNAAAEE